MPLNSKKILVAGGSGFIGANLARRLLMDGYHVRATYNTRPEAIPEHHNLEAVACDLTNAEDCRRAVDGCDFVFMCAAQTSGAAVITETPLAHVTPNVLMNTLLLDAAYNAHVNRFVFISTGCVYPDTQGRPVAEHEVLDAPPYDVYFSAGWMKRYAEILCRTYAEKISPSMPCTIIRPSNIYGPFDKFGTRTSHVTAAMIRKVYEQHNPLEIWGTGDDVRDVIYIDDFIEGLVLAAAITDDYFEVNIASGTGYSVLDILKTAMSVSSYSAEVVQNLTKPSTVPKILFNTSQAIERMNFRPQISLAEGIKRTFAWLKDTPSAIYDR